MIERHDRIYIIGAGGHGKVAVRAAQLSGIQVIAVFDDAPEKRGGTVCGVPIAGDVPSITGAPPLPTLIAIGNNMQRIQIAEQLKMIWATVVHPAAFVDPSVMLGAGVLVLANAVVQIDATLENHVIVNDNATVEHDCHVDAAAHVSCNACLAGGASVGKATLIGASATVLPGVRVGNYSLIGGGAVVVRDLGDCVTAIGVPAKVIKEGIA